MIRYLLGDLTEEEQAQIEGRFLADNQYFEQLCSVEDALIDEYAQGTLAEHEREKIESLLLSSKRQAHEIEFVRDMIKFVSEHPIDEPGKQGSAHFKPASKVRSLMTFLHLRSRRLSFAGMIFLIGIVVSLVLWNFSLQKRIRHMGSLQAVLEQNQEELRQQVIVEKDSREAMIKELESERREREQLKEKVITLQESGPLISRNNTTILDVQAAAFTRGQGQLRVVHINPNVSRFQIRIHTDKPGGYQTYTALIKTFEGTQVWSKDQIRPNQINSRTLVLTLPAAILNNDDYILTLEGRTEAGTTVGIGDYPFRVKRW